MPAAAKKTNDEEKTADVKEEKAEFVFPEDFYGNDWATATRNTLYWVKYIDGEDSYAVVSDDGDQQTIDAEEFNLNYAPASVSPTQQPRYIAARQAALDKAAAEKADKEKAEVLKAEKNKAASEKKESSPS